MSVWSTPLGQATLNRIREHQEAAAAQKKRAIQQRQYASARPSISRSAFFGSGSSANAELQSSLRALRDRSRQLIRDSAYAKRARQIIVDNVIGTGIGMQAGVRSTRGEMRKAVNTAISDAFWRWCDADSCHVAGQLHFCDLERQVMGQVFEAGEMFLRLHFTPFGGSTVPLSLELIEPEQVADDLSHTHVPGVSGRVFLGVAVDHYYRPQGYLIRDSHPGETWRLPGQTAKYELVPAEQIIHLRIVDRWPQLRGVPWLHAVISKLADMDGYTEAEIIAARAAANYFATIESPDGAESFGEEQPDGTYELPLQPGTVEKLNPGEKLNMVSPNRPNSALDPFLRYMLREMASGIPGVSYESISADYSQSNYSSSRMGLLDSRDAFRAIQQWFIRSFRERLHRVWLQQAVLAGAIDGVSVGDYATNRTKFEAVSFKPRGWSWVDPTKEVAAYKEAVKAGFTTVTDVIAQTDPQGRDAEEVFELREHELDEMAEKGLAYDTDPAVYVPAETGGHMMLTPEGLMPMATAVEAPIIDSGNASTEPGPEDEPDDDEPARSRVVSLRR